jgi:hypothetical protein
MPYMLRIIQRCPYVDRHGPEIVIDMLRNH